MNTRRRSLLKAGLLAGTNLLTGNMTEAFAATPDFPSRRPAPADRKFTSPVVEETIADVGRRIADPETAWLFANCFPNTLDTTVDFHDGAVPDTFVITGDIDAMWLRDSSAQVWPYLPLARRDPRLRRMLEGVIRRQVRCIQLDPYANAFLKDPNGVSGWAGDFPHPKPGVHERKWEVDSLCYPIRLAYGYWKQTGDTAPFDAEWERAMDQVLQVFHDQQRRDGHGPYYFQRGGSAPDPDAPATYGPPVKPVGLIFSWFRPSDDATRYPFLVPSNFFAVASLRQLAELMDHVRHRPEKASRAHALAADVADALTRTARQPHPQFGTIYAYEVDGLGHFSLMDDANIPSLLSLPYLNACGSGDPIYRATRRFALSDANPWFFQGKYRGGGSPHTGRDRIWPLSLIMAALTSRDEAEIAACLATLRATHAGTGFMHESFDKDNPNEYSRSWFAWANSLYGELILNVARRHPRLLSA